MTNKITPEISAAASALGRMALGKKKNLSPAQRDALRARIAIAGAKRWTKKPKNK